MTVAIPISGKRRERGAGGRRKRKRGASPQLPREEGEGDGKGEFPKNWENWGSENKEHQPMAG